MTAFPNIMVEEMSLSGRRAGDRASGGEVVPGGVSTRFDVGQRAEDITPERVQDFIDRADDMIDLVGDEFTLEYELLIRGASKLGVKGRARAFVRAKNPFEVTAVEVDEPQVDVAASDERLGRMYNVTARVRKE